VSNREDNTISVIDVARSEVLRTFSSHGEFPVKLRIRPDGLEVWVANNRSSSIAVFDARAFQHKGNVEVGSRPLGIIFSEDSSRAFVSRPGAAQVLEISTHDFEILRTIETPKSPDGMAFLASP
jgi:YVTN family beta-propeller protein